VTTSRSGDLGADAWGGLAAALVALPSSIAFGVAIYAPLGGSNAALGAVAGMLGAVLLGVVNPLLGGTQRLISAPCAPAAAVMGALAGELVRDRDPAAALLLMTSVALLSGLLQIAYGLLGGGKVIKYIPYPVVSGFMSGVAVLIFVKQLPGLLGVASGTRLLTALSAPEGWRVPSIVVGLITVAGVVLAPRITKAVPAAIIGLFSGGAAYAGLAAIDPSLRTLTGNPLVVGSLNASLGGVLSGLQERGAALAGFRLADLGGLVVPALTLSALLSIDTLKTGVIVDALTRSRSDSNRELRAQGIGNTVTAIFGGVPGAGTMGPTLINVTSGARTRLSGTFEGIFCLIAFLALARVVAWIPVAALSGILLVIAVRMVDRKVFGLLKNRSTLLDFAVISAVVIVAVAVGLVQASAAGFGLAVLLFAREQMAASVVRRKTHGDRIFSKQRRVDEETAVLAERGARTTVCELQGSLFFGTTDRLFTELAKDLETQDFVVLDLHRLQGVDYTAARLLDQMDQRLEEHGGRLVLSGIPVNLPTGQDVRTYFAALDIGKDSGGIETFDDLDAALEWVEDQVLEQALPNRPPRTAVLTLAQIQLFRDIEQDGALDEVAACLEEKSYEAGEKVFSIGDHGDELFVIRRGTVRILLPLAGGKTLHVASFGRGDFFGDMAFLDREPRSADAVALKRTDVFVLSRERVNQLSRAHPVVGATVFARLARALARRLRRTDAEVQSLRE
jgi:SulP family sulfate permease